ncbi:hypothetical protein K3495_g8017 [Podosphaera aphanis]|nr:hypothetical protein K3495_g8017 [Podosphaera aphanis]
MTIGSYEEMSFFYVTKLGVENPLILGIPWLRIHDLLIKWASLELLFCSRRYHENFLPLTSNKIVSAPKKTTKFYDQNKKRFNCAKISELPSWRHKNSIEEKQSIIPSAKILTLVQKSDSIYAPKENNLKPDMKDIKYSSAANFLQFCRDDLDREFGITDTESHQAMIISGPSEDFVSKHAIRKRGIGGHALKISNFISRLPERML